MTLFARFYNIHFHNTHSQSHCIIPAEHRITARTSIKNCMVTIDSVADLGYHRVKTIITTNNDAVFSVVINAKTITYQIGDHGYSFLLKKYKEPACIAIVNDKSTVTQK